MRAALVSIVALLCLLAGSCATSHDSDDYAAAAGTHRDLARPAGYWTYTTPYYDGYRPYYGYGGYRNFADGSKPYYYRDDYPPPSPWLYRAPGYATFGRD